MAYESYANSSGVAEFVGGQTVVDQPKSAAPIKPANRNVPASGRGTIYVYPDFNHTDLDARRKLQQKLLDNLKSQKIEHIAIEYAPSNQPLIDRFYSGKIDRAKFIEEMKKLGGEYTSGKPDEEIGMLADLISGAKERNVKVVAADRQASKFTPEEAKFIGEMQQILQKLSPDNLKKFQSLLASPDAATSKCIIDDLSKDPSAKEVIDFLQNNKELSDRVLDKRFGDDKQIGQNIKKHTGGANVAILYGGNHFGENGIHTAFPNAQFYDDRTNTFSPNAPDRVDLFKSFIPKQCVGHDTTAPGIAPVVPPVARPPAPGRQ